MKTFSSVRAATAWMDRACDQPANNDRVHGPFSFLAELADATVRCTIGAGLICRADEWRAR